MQAVQAFLGLFGQNCQHAVIAGAGNAADGLDLKKYPDLNAVSYAEQRLRPAPVADYVELAKGIQQKIQPFLKNSTGVTGIALVKKSYFMAMDAHGYFYLSSRSYTDPKMGKFTPHLHLKEAWNKIAGGKPMSWHEEYAVESLWHEIIHNRQKLAYLGSPKSIRTRIMEICTQWTARRTYPDFLKSLGASPSHLASIKVDGLGYGYYIKNFDRLLSVLNIDESVLLPEMRRIMDTIRRDAYLEELTTFLAKHSGQEKAIIRKAIDRTKKYQYNDELCALGLISED